MTPEIYLQTILSREAVSGPFSALWLVRSHLDPIVKEWAGSFLLDISPSGSFAKGTANKSGTDVDLFIPLSPNTKETLKEIYDKLFDRMQQKGLNPGRQNVSIKVEVNGYSVDLVPGKRHNLFGLDDSLYRRRADTWTKTNVTTHIAHIKAGGRTQENPHCKALAGSEEA